MCFSGYNKRDHNIWGSAQLTKPITKQKTHKWWGGKNQWNSQCRSFSHITYRISVRLDTVYFAENWKLKIIKKFTVEAQVTVHWPKCAVHVPWTVQNELKKKKRKKKKNANAKSSVSKPHLKWFIFRLSDLCPQYKIT